MTQRRAFVRAVALGCLMVMQAATASAQTYESCTKAEQSAIGEALTGAKKMALHGAANVGDTPHFERWFGTYSPRRAERVRRTLKAVVTAMRTGQITARCDGAGDDGCERGTYAWVYADEPYLIYLCPDFFTLPTLAQLAPGSDAYDNGTREGTLIHEVTHFLTVAETEDHCYSRIECAAMARARPADAVENADSYQYFSEDVMRALQDE